MRKGQAGASLSESFRQRTGQGSQPIEGSGLSLINGVELIEPTSPILVKPHNCKYPEFRFGLLCCTGLLKGSF